MIYKAIISNSISIQYFVHFLSIEPFGSAETLPSSRYIVSSSSSLSVSLTVSLGCCSVQLRMEPDAEGEWVWVRPPTEADSEFWGNGGNEDDEPSRPLKLVFTEPAKHWTDAAPIGNGRLGAMVWGNVPNETLQLNRKCFFLHPDSPIFLKLIVFLV